MAPSKTQIHFHGSHRQQNWPFKYSFINYITKNPTNAKAWQNLIQSCKYFFTKNPILVINILSLSCTKKWNIVLKKTKNKIPSSYKFQVPADFTNVLCKFWLTDGFDMRCSEKPSISFSTIFSYLYQVDVKIVNIWKHHTFSFHEFIFLTSNVEKIYLSHVTVKNEDGTIVPLEKLVKVLPKIKEIRISDNPIFSSFTKNTVRELLEIPHLQTIDKFDLYNITEKFDIETFFTYLKKNKHTKFHFRFHDIISEGYKNRVEKIIDEIIATPSHDYKIPFLFFYGIDQIKYWKMHSLFPQL